MTRTARGEARVRAPSGAEADLVDVEKALNGKEAPPEAAQVAEELTDAVDTSKDKLEAARAAKLLARREMMSRLESMGPGIDWDPKLRLHLLCAKRKRDEAMRAENGVTFQRRGADLYVEAGNRIVVGSVRLPKQAKNGPSHAVVPAAAMEFACTAEDLAQFWFQDAKCWVLADEVVAEFFLVQPDLPFDMGGLRSRNKAQRALAGVAMNAAEFVKLQKAFACEALFLRFAEKGVLSCYPLPGGSPEKTPNPDVLGFISLITDGGDE